MYLQLSFVTLYVRENHKKQFIKVYNFSIFLQTLSSLRHLKMLSVSYTHLDVYKRQVYYLPHTNLF